MRDALTALPWLNSKQQHLELMLDSGGRKTSHSATLTCVGDDVFAVEVSPALERAVRGENVDFAVKDGDMVYESSTQVRGLLKGPRQLLVLAIPRQVKKPEQRSFCRAPVDLSLVLHPTDRPAIETEAIDLSAGGAFVQADAGTGGWPAEGDELHAEFRLGDEWQVMRPRARVVAVSQGSRQARLKFLDLSQAEREQISEYVFRSKLGLFC